MNKIQIHGFWGELDILDAREFSHGPTCDISCASFSSDVYKYEPTPDNKRDN
jgi:hypothetical protein